MPTVGWGELRSCGGH